MIKMIIFDIDGVLTDGMVQIDENGQESKRFCLNDIDALHQMVCDGISIGVITGEDNPFVSYIYNKVSWTYFVKGCKEKLTAFKKIIQSSKYALEEVAYIGDGLYDVSVLEYVPKSVCPANAVPAARAAAKIHLNKSGGNGCVVEFYDLIKCGGI